MRFQCHIGTGVRVLPPAVIRAAAPRVLPAKRASARHRKLPGYAAVASGALLAIAGCASFDSKVVKAWAVEPVLSVMHSGQSSQAYYAMGRYLDGSQAWDKSIDAYRKSIAADAQNVEAYNALGVALAQSGRLADAETTLRQAVALAPGLAHVRSNLGCVLLLAGKPGEAVTELKAAVRQDSTNAIAVANLRDALAQANITQYATVAAARSAPATNAEASDDAATTISVPTPITSAEVPMPLAAAVSVPTPLQTASMPAPELVAALAPASGIAADAAAPLASDVAGTSIAKAKATNPRVPELPAIRERAMRLEVSNGNGVNGMAARVGRWLATQGVQTDRLTNQQPFGQRQTVIQYRNGHEEAALRVARSLPANAKAEPMPTQGLRSDVRVVLGRDWVQTAACLGRDTCQPVGTAVAVATNPK